MVDISFTTGLKVAAFLAGTDSILDRLRDIAADSLLTAGGFEELENKANELGTTIEAVAAVSSETVDAFADWRQSNEQLATSLSSTMSTVLRPYVDLIAEGERNVSDLVNSLQDLGRAQGNTRDFANALGLVNPFLPGLLGLPAARGFERSEAQLQAIADADRNRQDAIQRQQREERIEARQRINQEFFGDVGRVRGQFAERREDTIRADQQRRFFEGQNRQAFAQNQRISREAFIAQQQLDLRDRGGVSLDLFRRRQAIELQKFDISQQAQREQQQVRDQNRANQAQIRSDEKLGKLNMTAREQLAELRRQRVINIQQADAEILAQEP